MNDKLFKQYENFFKEQQKLKSLGGDKENFSNCLHTQCSSCKGTGIKQVDKSMCIHMLSCPCSRCIPQC